MRAIRQASVEDLAKAPGMNKKAAVAIVKYFETAVGTMPVGEYESEG